MTDLFSKDGHNIFHHIHSSRTLLSRQGMKSHSPLLEFCDYLGTNRIWWKWRCVAPEMRPEKVLYFLPCLLAHSLLKPSVTVSSPAVLRPPHWEEAQASPDTETIERLLEGRETSAHALTCSSLLCSSCSLWPWVRTIQLSPSNFMTFVNCER